MKSYIQDLCGDENPIVIDVAILQCMLQDAIFEKLVGSSINSDAVDIVHNVLWDFIGQYDNKPARSIDLTLKRGDDGESTCTLLL